MGEQHTMRAIITAIAALVMGIFGPIASAQANTAKLQVIHNAADPAGASVDIYVNGGLLLDNFAFRAATPFVEVPAGVTLSIGVAPGTSTSAAEALATFDVILKKNKRYVAMASGVLNPAAFAANPDGRSTGFNLFLKEGVREGDLNGLVRVLAIHGATDAPTVDIIPRKPWGDWSLFNDLGYGEFSGDRVLQAKSYVLDVTPGNDTKTVVASFTADLTGLGGGAAVVFASGFLTPASNQNGPGFGLYAALPDGQVVALPPVTPMAKLQVIHNAADPAAASVDVYVNGSLLLDNFAFRAATPFVEVPAGVQLNVAVAPGSSTSASQALATFPVTLEANKSYVAIANGVLGSSGFAGNPDGQSIGFTIFPFEVSTTSAIPGLVRVYAFHGVTDAPTVDVVDQASRSRNPLFNDLTYGELSSSLTLPPKTFVLDVTLGADNDAVVASYTAPLNGLNGQSVLVFASGFLTPSANQGGPAFGLYAVLGDGTVIALPTAALAKITPETVVEAASILPGDFVLDQNYPNPFNPSTTISFSLPAASDVNLKVYNILGQELATLVDGPMDAGQHNVVFDAGGLATGMYLYRLSTGAKVETRKMMLVK
jgi:hypothetical protein